MTSFLHKLPAAIPDVCVGGGGTRSLTSSFCAYLDHLPPLYAPLPLHCPKGHSYAWMDPCYSGYVSFLGRI